MVCLPSPCPLVRKNVDILLIYPGTRRRLRWQEAKEEVVERKGYVGFHSPSLAPSILAATISLSISWYALTLFFAPHSQGQGQPRRHPR